MNWHDIFYIEDDKLFNKVDRGARAMAGKEAGCLHKNSGYVVVRVDDKLLKAHRIIYEMRHGAIPEGMEVDHIDHNRSNNSDSNHRLVTHKENTQNVTRRKTNNSGCTGVYWYESRSNGGLLLELARAENHLAIILTGLMPFAPESERSLNLVITKTMARNSTNC